MFSQQLRGTVYAIRPSNLQIEFAAERPYIQVYSTNIAILRQPKQALGTSMLTVLLFSQSAILRKKRFPICRQALHQFVFCFLDIFNASKSFQMLVADAGQNPVIWLCNIAQLFDLSTTPGAHFAYKHLMLIVEHLTNHARNAHRRIIAAGRYQHIIFFLQDRS